MGSAEARPYLVGYDGRLRAAPHPLAQVFSGTALFRAGAWISIQARGKVHGLGSMAGVCRRDSGPLGPGLCRMLDTDFREHPF